MGLDRFRDSKKLNRYRAMFTTSMWVAGPAAVATAVGLIAWAVGPMPAYLPWSMLLVGIGGMLAYRVVTSTARILDRNGRVPGE